MKTKIFIFISIILQSFIAFTQDNNTPFLLGNCTPKEKITIVDNRFDKYFTDSLKIHFSVIVNFKHDFFDISKPIIVESVNIRNIYIKSDIDNIVIKKSYLETERNGFQKQLWIFTDSLVNDWYRRQDYKKLPNRNEWNKQIALTGGFYIVKKK